MKTIIEVLTFEGCPNADPALALARRAAAEHRPDAEIRLVEVTTAEAAQRLRFLGSPSIRINGTDVEPGADERTDFQLACRVYRAADRFRGLPDEGWVRRALTADEGSERSKT